MEGWCPYVRTKQEETTVPVPRLFSQNYTTLEEPKKDISEGDGSPMKKLTTIFCLVIIATILLPATVVLAYLYRAPVSVTENTSTSYDMLPVLWTQNNIWLANNGFMSSSGNDTRVQTLGGLNKPWMVADNKTLTAIPVEADSQTNLYFVTGESEASAMDIIVGHGGYITRADDPDWELGNNGTVEISLYYDSTNTTDILSKAGACRISGNGAGDISAGIFSLDTQNVTPLTLTAWTDVDVSQYIDTDATGVILEIVASTKNVGVRKNGSTDNRIGDMFHNWAMVGIDASGIFEAYVEDATVNIFLVGYTDARWTFKTNANDISLGAGFGAWTDIDVTGNTTADTVGVVVEIVTTGVARQSGVRKDGSVDARQVAMGATSHFFAVIGVDPATEIFEMYAADNTVDCYLIGYVESGATFATNATAKSLAGAGAWTDIDCSVEAPDAEFLIFEVYDVTGGANTYGFRKNGSSDTTLEIENDGRGWAVVACDENQVVEGYVDNLAVDFFLVGYITEGARLYYDAKVEATAVSSGEADFGVGIDSPFFGMAVDTDLALPVTDNLTMNAPLWQTECSSSPFSTIDTVANSLTVNGATWVADEGYSFDGVNDYLEDATVSGMPSGTAITLESWFILDNVTNNQTVMACGDHASYSFWNIQIISGKLRFRVGNSAGSAFAENWLSTSSLTAATRYHVVATYDNSTTPKSLVYVNNTPVAGTSSGSGGSIITPTTYLTVGRTRSGASYYLPLAGDVGECRVYAKSFSASEVAQNYNATKSKYSSGDIYTYSTLSTVPNNDNSWLLYPDPYWNYYKHYVGGTLVGWYQPASMILTTVMPDRAGVAEDGVITWGANPTGVGATLGSFTSSGLPSIGAASDTSTSDILPPVGGTDWRPDATVSPQLQANPMRPIVTAISDNTTLSEYQAWVWLGIIFVVFITVLVGANVRGHHLITGIAALAAIILMVVWTVFPLFSLLVVVLAIWGRLVSERSPSL